LEEGAAGLFIDGAQVAGSGLVGTDIFDMVPVSIPGDPQVVAKGKAINTRYKTLNGKKVSFYGLFVEVEPLRVG
jgi:hypothetical protein